MRFLTNVWKGNYPLGISFWVLAVLPFVIATVGFYATPLFVEGKDRAVMAAALVAFVGKGFTLFALKGAWSAARKHTGKKIWALLTYVLVILMLLITLKGFALSIAMLHQLLTQ